MTKFATPVGIAIQAAIAAVSFVLVSSSVAAPVLAAETSGTQLIMLGTSGGPTVRRRAEPSTLLLVDGTPYLIDAGVGAVRHLVQAGVEPPTVGTVFITHLHPDHTLDLANLMASDFFSIGGNENGATWNIYGPPGISRLVDGAAQYLSVPFETFAAEDLTGTDIRSHFITHEIAQSGVVYKDDKIRIIAGENAHFALMTPKQRETMKSYSYRVETPHGVVVFTGDTGPSEAVAKLAKGADVLVSEVINVNSIFRTASPTDAATRWSEERRVTLRRHLEDEHLVPSAVAHIANEAKVGAVVLYHLVPGRDDDVAADVAGVQAGYGGPVFAAEDLTRYCLDISKDKGKALSTCPAN